MSFLGLTNFLAHYAFTAAHFLAQATGAEGGGGGGGDGGAAATQERAPWYAQLLSSPMFPLMMILVVFMVIMSRSRRAQEKQRVSMLEQIKRGDRVQTIGGILGTVVNTEADRILVKVDENSNTKIWFVRRAIDRVVQPEGEKVEASKKD